MWWWLINALFPQALITGLIFQWSPSLFLIAFVLFWLIFNSMGSNRVPYYPTPHVLRPLIEQNWPVETGGVLEVGCGFGGWSLYLQQKRPELRITGIEIAWLPWLISWWRSGIGASACRFLRGDFRQIDWSAYDVVYVYLSPLVMEAVWQQANQQMRPGSWLISCEFDIQSQPGQMLFAAPLQGLPTVYIWQIGMQPDFLNGVIDADY